MWQKLASILLGALIEQLPKIVASITKAVSNAVEAGKEKVKQRKALKEIKDAKTKEERKSAIDKLP